MNAPATKTKDLHATLEAAKDKRQLERARLEQAQQELQHSQRVAENHTKRLQEAIADEHAADIEGVAKIAAKRRDIEAMANAAKRRLTEAETKVASCQASVVNANRDVERAVDTIVLHEAELIAAELSELDRQARAKREHLIALRLANPVVANSRVAAEAVDQPTFFAISQYSNQLAQSGPHIVRLHELRDAHAQRRTQLIAN